MEVDPVKLICLNEPVNVGTDAPDVRLMFSLFDSVAPKAFPNSNVFVADIAADIFDVPVNVKFVTAVISSTFAAAVVVVKVMPPVVPNAIERVLELFDAKVPVDNVKLFKSRVPLVSVVVSAVSNVRLFVIN